MDNNLSFLNLKKNAPETIGNVAEFLLQVKGRNSPDPRGSTHMNHECEGEIDRGSYISAHVLLNLLNKLGKRDKMRGLPSILSLFSQRV